MDDNAPIVLRNFTVTNSQDTDIQYCTVVITPSDKQLFPVWNIQLSVVLHPPIQKRYFFEFDFSKVESDFKIVFDNNSIQGTFTLDREIYSCFGACKWRIQTPPSSKKAVLSVRVCPSDRNTSQLLFFSGFLNDGACTSYGGSGNIFSITYTPNMSSNYIFPISCYTSVPTGESCNQCGVGDQSTCVAEGGGFLYTCSPSSSQYTPSFSLMSSSTGRTSCTAYPTYNITLANGVEYYLSFTIYIPQTTSTYVQTPTSPYTNEDCAGNSYTSEQIIPPINISAADQSGSQTTINLILINSSQNNDNGCTLLGSQPNISDNIYDGSSVSITCYSLQVIFYQQNNGFFNASVVKIS